MTDATLQTAPLYPTMVRRRFADGRMLNVDGNSMWLYRRVPMGAVEDAVTPGDALKVGAPLMAAMDMLADLPSFRTKRRRTAKDAYRQVHLLWVNVPRVYTPPRGPLAAHLSSSFSQAPVMNRVLLFGVKLNPRLGTGGFKSAIDSVVESMVAGGTPLEDYDRDFNAVDQVLARAGLVTMTQEHFRLANAWWNPTFSPDIPYMPHSDHMHFFRTADASARATRAGLDACENWPEGPDAHEITFAAVEDVNLEFVEDTNPASKWFLPFSDMGAIVASIRGTLEPPQITRAELRHQRKEYVRDITKAMNEGLLNREEHEAKLAQLTSVEGIYSEGRAPATLVNGSIVIGFNGHVDSVEDLSTEEVTLNSMLWRQPGAWAETMIASSVRANPHAVELPSVSVGMSGLPSLSTVGDASGALVGFTERDRQPAYLSPTAASTADGLPVALVAGQTGSGKACGLDTKVPTPSGWTTMGDLRVGSEVLGRDGRPCRVTFLSEVNEQPDLYRITFSDGQTVDADFDHQWVVSTFSDRNAARKSSHVAAIENWAVSAETVSALRALASTSPDVAMSTVELADYVSQHLTDNPWPTGESIYGPLHMSDVPSHRVTRRVPRQYCVDEVRKTDPVVLFPVTDTLRATRDVWSNVTGGNATRWADSTAAKKSAATALLERDDLPDEATSAEISRMLVEAGAVRVNKSWIAETARRLGVQPRKGRAEVVVPLPAEMRSTIKTIRVFPLREALTGLADRLEFQMGEQPNLEPGERVLTTGEMLGEGLTVAHGAARFAVRLTEPLDLPDAELPVDPYVLGAWLGDGSTGLGYFTVGSSPACTDGSGTTDRDYLIRELSRHYDDVHGISRPLTVSVPGLQTDLREAGVLRRKHIPLVYLRASRAQRLALLQGIMDTDGTISSTGGCEIALSDETLAAGVLELVRSLGIRASSTVGRAGYRKLLPDGGSEFVQCKDRHRIKFTTTLHVFRLPRKLERIPAEVRETQQWNYITSIEPIESRPARCIQVDSPDATYLVGGFVPTHNTQLLLWLADQFARNGNPSVIIDPKLGSDHSVAVQQTGGQVASLDDMVTGDGILDPLRFAQNPHAAVQAAASMLTLVNPWGADRDRYEVDLLASLEFGIQQGATCTGQALQLAEKAGVAPPEMVAAVMKLANSFPMFRACFGMNPGTNALRFADGITLIKVGSTNLELPKPGQHATSLTQRVSVAVVRMMVFGSMMALTGRGGVLHLDEAWVILDSTPDEVERVGRLARSQGVLPILYTQRVTDAVRAGLSGYISRGLIGPIADPEEARAACTLFKLDPTPDRLGRITAAARVAGSSGEEGSHNWYSMRALVDRHPDGTVEVQRGAVFTYIDLAGRAIPTEITLPKDFLKAASTNPEDIRKRLAQQR